MGVPLNMRWTVITAAIGLGVEGAGSAFLGPGADLGIITGAWVAMFLTLAGQAGVALERNTALKIVTALIMSLGAFLGGTKMAIQAFSVTGVGTIPAMAANLGINGVVTYVVGMNVASLFSSTKRIDSVDAFIKALLAMVLSSLGFGGGDDS